jgi:hypothetical protein
VAAFLDIVVDGFGWALAPCARSAMKGGIMSIGTLQRVVISGLAIGWVGCSNDLKVSDVDPPNGAYLGGDEVVIEGSGFQPGRSAVAVRFDRREAQNVVVASSKKIKVTTPPGDRNTAVDVSVTFDDGKMFVLRNAFRYIDAQQKATMDEAFNAIGHTGKK